MCSVWKSFCRQGGCIQSVTAMVKPASMWLQESVTKYWNLSVSLTRAATARVPHYHGMIHVMFPGDVEVLR